MHSFERLTVQTFELAVILSWILVVNVTKIGVSYREST